MKRHLFILVFALLAAVSTTSVQAQCSLCKSSAESSLEEGNKQAAGLNMGIMYLLAMPYLLVGGIGYYWYTKQRRKKPLSAEER